MMAVLQSSNSTLPCQQGRQFFLSTQQWWGCLWSIVSSPELPSSRKIQSYWSESCKGPQRWLRNSGACLIWGEAERAGLFTLEKMAQGNLTKHLTKHLVGRNKRESCSSVVPKWQVKRQLEQMKTQNFISTQENTFFTVRLVKHWKRSPIQTVESPPMEIWLDTVLDNML